MVKQKIPGNNGLRVLTLYRDDSTTQVVYKNVKHYFFTCNNTVLTIAQITNIKTGAHRYIHWPRERFCWFKDEKAMIIALDYDKTYTSDVSLWNDFIKLAKVAGHKVICITMRKPNKEEEIDRDKFKVDQLFYTSRKAKKKWADENGISVDIWIDDKPAWLFEDALS